MARLTQKLLEEVHDALMKDGGNVPVVMNKKGEPCYSGTVIAPTSTWKQILGKKDYNRLNKMGCFVEVKIP